MRTDEIIQGLKYNAKKHENDRVFTGQLNITSMCKDLIPKMEQLKAYEDAEEQGLFFRLPCKVGDTVYKLGYKPCHHGYDYPDSYGCCGCMDECDLERAIFERKADCLTFIINEFVLTTKNTVYFLTKEEAEQKLAEMKEGAV